MVRTTKKVFIGDSKNWRNALGIFDDVNTNAKRATSANPTTWEMGQIERSNSLYYAAGETNGWTWEMGNSMAPPKIKTVSFHRNQDNGAGACGVYYYCSGSTTGPIMYLLKGDEAGDQADRMIYGRTMKDFKNRIWLGGLYSNQNVNYSTMFIYTYPNSCNSWKTGGTDYWFWPNGDPAGSGTAVLSPPNNTIKRPTWGDNQGDYSYPVYSYINYGVCSSCNAGPMKGMVGYPQGVGNPWIYNIMPNGELVVITDYITSTGERRNGIYYMSANMFFGQFKRSGNWVNSFTMAYPRVGSGTTYSRDIAITKNNVMFFYTSAGKLCGRLSTNNARTFGAQQIVESMNNSNYMYCTIDSIANEGRIDDDYVRLFIQKLSGVVWEPSYEWNALASDQFIYKINTNNVSDKTCVKTYDSGASYSVVQGGRGTHLDGITLFQFPYGSSSRYGGSGNNAPGNPGDPRVIHYYDENTGAHGIVRPRNTGNSPNFRWTSHIGTACRFMNDGMVVSMASGYSGPTDDALAYRGVVMNADLCSGLSYEHQIGTINDNIQTVIGGCCHGLEVLQNIE